MVLGNLVREYNIKYTYIDKYDPWVGILVDTAFENKSTANRLRGYTPGQLIFGSDMILPIKHMVDWEVILQKKQTQIINITFVKIVNEYTTAIKLEIKSCLIIMLL